MPVRSASLSARWGELRRWRLVEVSGPSMVPTLRHGDRILVHEVVGNGVAGDGAVRPGDVVLARFRDLPDRLVVKRAQRRVDGGWWIVSDNPFAGGDSGSHGVADVTAVVRWRLAPGRPGRVRRDVGVPQQPVEDWPGRANPETRRPAP